MRNRVERKITLPEGFTAELKDNVLTVKGNSRELSREFNLARTNLVLKGNELIISADNASKRELTTIGTTRAHINNLIKGVEKDFEYVLEVCNVHFPMNVKVEGQTVVIKSFLGEKVPRISKIIPGVKVDIKGSQITVTCSEVEKAGQTAANLEKATRLTGRDRRIFQDGIFITNKNGRII